MEYTALLHAGSDVGHFHGSLWGTECLKTYELLGFVRQLNHLSHWYPNFSYMQILHINSAERTCLCVYKNIQFDFL